MKTLFLLTILVVAASALPSDMLKLMNRIYLAGRIIKGEDTPINKLPHQVSIDVYGQFDCGGSIIASEWILTAAHCGLKPTLLYEVRTGSNTSEYGGQVHNVAKIYLHEEFSVNVYGIPRNDIALFRLEKPIQFNEKQRPVTLFDKDEEAEVGAYAVVSGYGTTETGHISDTLQSAVIPVISKDDCSNAYLSRFRGIEVNQICAGYPDGGQDACAGDSGGPLTIGGRLAGVVSWGDGCGKPGSPGVYTEVSKYRDWIADKTGLHL